MICLQMQQSQKEVQQPKLMNAELKNHSKFWKAVFTHFPTPATSCSLNLAASSSVEERA